MENFDFRSPSSVDEAKAALASSEDAKYMAGGQSLIPIMKLDLAAPPTVVSLNGIGGLGGVAVEDGVVFIGATTTHSQVADSADVQRAIPALAALAGAIGDPQVRNRGTLGGSIAHADPAADYPAALLALGATVVTDRSEHGAEDFFTGMFQTALAEDEIVMRVRFPIPEAATYAKFANPASKYAIVGVMVAKNGNDVRVAVTGAAPTVFRATEMEAALAGDFSAGTLDGVAVSADGLTSDPDASAEYRAHLVGVMARRAVEACG